MSFEPSYGFRIVIAKIVDASRRVKLEIRETKTKTDSNVQKDIQHSLEMFPIYPISIQ